MAANIYEGMFIFDSTRYSQDPNGVPKKINELVTSAGGEMMTSRLWEERRLAYPIKGQHKGTYWLTYFRVDSDRLAGLNRQCRISDTILRHLFLKVDPRVADALIAHAQSSEAAPESSRRPAARRPANPVPDWVGDVPEIE